MKYILLVAMLLTLALGSFQAEAGPSANRVKDGPGLLDSWFGDSTENKAPASKENHPEHTDAAIVSPTDASVYNGIWKAENGQLLLIKRIHRTLFLSGSSSDAAWQAQCVSIKKEARCIGSGSSKSGGEFNYVSNMDLQAASLKIDWNFKYASGHPLSGQSIYQKNH